MVLIMTRNYYKALCAAPDSADLWRNPEPFATATPSQRRNLYVEMSVRGWERWHRPSGRYFISLPCGLVWERIESADGRSWSVADVTTEFIR